MIFGEQCVRTQRNYHIGWNKINICTVIVNNKYKKTYDHRNANIIQRSLGTIYGSRCSL